MKTSPLIGIFALFPTALSTASSPPVGIAKYCNEKGQVAQQVNGVWKCAQVSDICSTSEDFETFHRDDDTDKWGRCLKGFQVKNGRCVLPPPKCETVAWLSLENDSSPKRLISTGHEKMTLPNPNKQLSHYVYPFDVWVTKLAEGDLTLYINGKEVIPHSSGVDFLIPAGTVADDVSYNSRTGTMILFYGSCSSYNPCVGRELVPWTRGVSNKRLGQQGEIDVRQYDTDLVLTIADTETTSEQYTVYADGKEIGSTHGRLTLGKDKYNRERINRINVGSGAAGALRSIANDGFWGSFRIPRGTRKVTISDEDSDYDFVFEYRLDKACNTMEPSPPPVVILVLNSTPLAHFEGHVILFQLLQSTHFIMPRFIYFMKANAMAEAPPCEISPEIFEAMCKYNEELNDAGILLEAEGLRPTSVDSYRLHYSTDNLPEVTSGPFDVTTETHICGWWVVRTKDAKEALEWAKKIPMQSGEIVLRRIGCMEELGEGYTKQLQEREAKVRFETARRIMDLAEKKQFD
ncbi:hypothetical protein MKX07_006054 [Trichoderma sp. CBMAI-0711]|nr:hypothetical protein MKX07_006054 [Trichoderma sp. CBMAI-0711]